LLACPRALSVIFSATAKCKLAQEVRTATSVVRKWELSEENKGFARAGKSTVFADLGSCCSARTYRCGYERRIFIRGSKKVVENENNLPRSRTVAASKWPVCVFLHIFI
jgi:hypothetical protein